MDHLKFRVVILGMGYVGLPLAIEFGKVRPTIGFDIDPQRVNQLVAGFDKTRAFSQAELSQQRHLFLTSNLEDLLLDNPTIFVVTVPTPIDENLRPDLSSLVKACRIVGQRLKLGDIVVFESTVYPGCTEEDCIPILEEESGLRFNKDFYCGYSPERLNPGDQNRSVATITKVVAGSTPEVLECLAELYGQIVSAGIHKAESIRIAEAAKVIENTQRDLNVALVNELSLIFEKLGIDTEKVLKAAESKWNFMSFRPGLVGGHCIGVDPYYLTHKAQMVGYEPQVILAGRRVNDSMPKEIARRFADLLGQRDMKDRRPKVLVLGITFKENVPDLRNSKAAALVSELELLGMDVSVWDPVANPDEASELLGFEIFSSVPDEKYSGVIAAVGHDDFVQLRRQMDFRSLLIDKGIIFDLKYIFDSEEVDLRL